MMRVVGIIPARYDSQRLPHKLLLKKTGKYLIQHVYERVITAKKLDRILVATDDVRIANAVSSFGGEAVLTSSSHTSGTQRVAEAARKINCKIVINIQGDEPEIESKHIDCLVDLMKGSDAHFGTLATSFAHHNDFLNPSKVKVVMDTKGYALYFSRAPIPYGSNGTLDKKTAFLHMGIYGYQKAFLLKFPHLSPTRLEQIERLEQLRALAHGYKIRVGIVKAKPFGGIDTQKDYDQFVARYKKRRPQ